MINDMAGSETCLESRRAMLQRPTEKQSRYDRQLRLWAESGQTAIESAHVVVVNDALGAVTVETLKNLVLPGKMSCYWAQCHLAVILQRHIDPDRSG